MGCCHQAPRTSTPPPTPAIRRKEETLLHIPNAVVHLAGDPDAVELGRGDLTILRVTDGGVPLATVVKVGGGLRWPLAKDEPVVKLDRLHYLFTIPEKDGSFINYGVSFDGEEDGRLGSLDRCLQENACFSVAAAAAASSSSSSAKPYWVFWKEYAPEIEDYNGALAKAIAQGTGEIVKGIFKLSNGYTALAQKGADLMKPRESMEGFDGGKESSSTKRGTVNNTLHRQHPAFEVRWECCMKRGCRLKVMDLWRVRKLSEMTENMSKTLLNGVVAVSGSVTAPLIQSKAGKSFFTAIPGEVILASLDAITRVLDATEVAERRALGATSGAVAGAVSKRFGESAGEATEDVFATAGHAVGTAWNVLKIRRAFSPKSSVSSAVLSHAAKKKA